MTIINIPLEINHKCFIHGTLSIGTLTSTLQDFTNCCIRSVKVDWYDKRLAITGNDDGHLAQAHLDKICLKSLIYSSFYGPWPTFIPVLNCCCQGYFVIWNLKTHEAERVLSCVSAARRRIDGCEMKTCFFWTKAKLG